MTVVSYKNLDTLISELCQAYEKYLKETANHSETTLLYCNPSMLEEIAEKKRRERESQATAFNFGIQLIMGPWLDLPDPEKIKILSDNQLSKAASSLIESESGSKSTYISAAFDAIFQQIEPNGPLRGETIDAFRTFLQNLKVPVGHLGLAIVVAKASVEAEAKFFETARQCVAEAVDEARKAMEHAAEAAEAEREARAGGGLSLGLGLIAAALGAVAGCVGGVPAAVAGASIFGALANAGSLIVGASEEPTTFQGPYDSPPEILDALSEALKAVNEELYDGEERHKKGLENFIDEIRNNPRDLTTQFQPIESVAPTDTYLEEANVNDICKNLGTIRGELLNVMLCLSFCDLTNSITRNPFVGYGVTGPSATFADAIQEIRVHLQKLTEDITYGADNLAAAYQAFSQQDQESAQALANTVSQSTFSDHMFGTERALRNISSDIRRDQE